MTYLFAGDLPDDEATSFANAMVLTESSILMAFYPDRFTLKTITPEEIVLEKSEQGRIFSPESELQWRRIGGKLRLVYLGEMSPPEGLEDCSKELDGLEQEKKELLLWGKRTDLENEWIEQQVPVRFTYPITGNQFSKGRVKLVVEQWIDPSGHARFSRYQTLEEMEGES